MSHRATEGNTRFGQEVEGSGESMAETSLCFPWERQGRAGGTA